MMCYILVQMGIYSILAISVMILLAILFEPVMENYIRNLLYLVITLVCTMSFPKEIKAFRAWSLYLTISVMLMMGLNLIWKEEYNENNWLSALIFGAVNGLTGILS